MFNKTILSCVAIVSFCFSAMAEEIPVTGNVASKCVVTQDTLGVYGNPDPSTLSTKPSDGGIHPVVRYDVVQASYYKARISAPDSFTSSPELNDTVAWTNWVTVDQVSDATMSSYDTDKIYYDNITEVALTVAGSTWFKVQSTADYGFDKAFPGGQYQASVTAECIAI
jgi:hypothetical protein